MPRDLRWHPSAIAAAVRGRLRALFDRERLDREFDEELRFHLDLESEKHVRAGMSAAEARREALRSFGGVDHMTEQQRDARGVRVVTDALADLRLAARTLGRTPGFVAVSTLTLAITIAIGTLVFTAANAFFYRPLSVPGGDRILSVFTSDYTSRRVQGASSWADIMDLAREAEPVADLAGESRLMLAIAVHDDLQYVQGAVVSSRYFRVAGVRPALGRFPSPEAPGAPAIVLSHDFWRRALGADSSQIGRTVRANGQPLTIVAVAPPAFHGMSREHAVDFWIDGTVTPLVLLRDDMLRRRGNRSFRVVGRLREGRTLAALNARLAIVADRLVQEHPDAWRDETGMGRFVTAMREQDAMLANVRRSDRLVVVGGVITFGLGLLAIACANLASMQMARGASRRREIATRLALGAGRGRLVRQLLAECALVAMPGLALGAGLAIIVATLVSAFRPIPVPSLDLSLDWRALSFMAGSLLLTLLLFGLVPALQTVRADVLTDLKGGGQPGARGLPVGGVRGGLIVAQVALSVVFTAAAGLVAFALVQNANTERGDARRILVTRVNFLPAGGDSIRVAATMAEVLAGMASIPGVEGATASSVIPVRGTRQTVDAEVRTAAGASRRHELDANTVLPGYFGVMGYRLLRGRDFEPRDLGGGYRAAIVSRAMADALWPGEEPLGRLLRIGEGTAPADVIGVVADPAGFTPATDRSFPGLLYLPMHFQREAEIVLHVRVSGGPASIATVVAGQLRRHDRSLAAPTPITLDAYLDGLALPHRIMARASAVVAAIQIVLAIAGLSGLVACVTAARRREIGIRSALGATRRSVIALVMRQGVTLTATGGVIGIALSALVARVIAQTMTVSVAAAAAGVLLAVVTFTVVGTVAMLIPARRALDVSPGVALRVD